MGTAYISPTTLADDTGADITVGATSVGIEFFGQDGNEIVGVLKRKSSDGNYYRFRAKIADNKSATEVMLCQSLGDFSITKPGIYKIEKFATKGTAGIDIVE